MKFFCAVCVLCGFALRTFALDREAFTFTDYDLNVRVEPEQQRLAVRGKIILRNDSAKPQNSLVLQISSSLDWRSIRVGGKAAHFVTQEYNSDIDHTGALSEAIVNLPQEIQPKGTVDLDVGYEGVIPLDTSRLTRIGVPEEKAKHGDWDQISKSFTAVRGIGYVTWYPVATEDASLTEGNSVEETVGRWQAKETQENLRVVLTYLRASAEAPPTLLCGGSETHQLTADCSLTPMGLATPTFVIANYQKLTPKGAVTVQYLPGQEEAAKDYAEVGAAVDPMGLAGRSSTILEIAGLPDPEAPPFVTEGMLLTPLKSPMTNEAELSIVYAKARHLVRSPRAWIQDGLAHFAQAEFIEKQKGRQAALDYLTAHANGLVEAEKHVAERPSDRDSSRSLINAPDDRYLQTKAMYVWWMLKEMLGNPAVDALLNYHAADDKDPSYMPQLMEKQSQRDLKWFFDDWVYNDRGLPDFRVDSVFSTPIQTGGFLVTITVENLGNAGAEVPLTLQIEGGEIRKRLEVRARSKASIRVEAPSAPQQVTVNDGSVPEADTGKHTYKIEQSSH